MRRGIKQETLFVVDDIADSFDYQNKYAIIQYLEDISDGPVFKQIILTHNFDFFRTVSSRFVGYSGCLMANKTAKETALVQAEGIKNIFVHDWKKFFFLDNKKKIACIPFMRNLIEFTRGENDPDFATLTSALHWEKDSTSLTVRNLDTIYNKLFGLLRKQPLRTLVMVLSISLRPKRRIVSTQVKAQTLSTKLFFLLLYVSCPKCSWSAKSPILSLWMESNPIKRKHS